MQTVLLRLHMMWFIRVLQEVQEAEEYYRRAMYTFNKHQLICGPPSIYTAMAYLDLKGMEMMVLVNVIESVKYGVPYHAGLAELVGA